MNTDHRGSNRNGRGANGTLVSMRGTPLRLKKKNNSNNNNKNNNNNNNNTIQNINMLM